MTPTKQEIVRRVAGLFALADQLEQRLAQARLQVDQLTPSLLARAFAGKLVPQNPADEPAEKLLEGIGSGQNNPSKPRKRTGTTSEANPNASVFSTSAAITRWRRLTRIFPCSCWHSWF